MSKTNESVRRRVELLQDFTMPAASSKLVQSPDGRYIMAAGTYPPRIRCYDVHELSLKFERYVNATVLDMVMLGSDYGKLALLLDDRTVAFHAHYGAHESIRIPTFGRAMAYEPTNCELLIAAKGDLVYRVNLDEGRFSEPWSLELKTTTTNNSTSSSTSGTCISVHPLHPLATVGCDDGTVRFWDSRSSDTHLRPFLKLDVGRAGVGYGYADTSSTSRTINWNEISSTAHDSSGLYMAFGTAGGLVALYDIRSSRPLFIQEHKHGLPIHTVRFHASSSMILSSDEKLVKVWRYKSSTDGSYAPATTLDTEGPTGAKDDLALGAVKVNIEGTGKFTHFIVAGDEQDSGGDQSGLILCATDQPKMDSFYVPALGVAPKWCSYLENITEELEERDLKRDGTSADPNDLVHSGQESVFENYKFVTRENLEQLGVSNLIGTPLLRGYMHGFFMDINLYNRVKAVANPFEYEEYQKKKLQERLKAKQSSRIAPRAIHEKKTKIKTAVNTDLAERLENKATGSTKTGRAAKGLLSDDRFGNLFTNPDFEIDQEDEDFKLRNPSGVSAKNKKNNLDSDSESDDEEDVVERAKSDTVSVEDNYVDSYSEGGSLNDRHALDEINSDSDDDGFKGAKVRGEAYEAMKDLDRKSKKRIEPAQRESQGKHSKPAAQSIVMVEADEGDVSGGRMERRRLEMSLPLAQRQALHSTAVSAAPKVRVQQDGSNKEAVYYPRNSKQQRSLEENNEGSSEKRIRRGVKDLGLRKAKPQNHK